MIKKQKQKKLNTATTIPLNNKVIPMKKRRASLFSTANKT
jgi:hypothetical protein